MLRPIQTDGDTVDVLQQLERFDVGDARCYDPNEEARIRRVIDAVGVDSFNTRIRNLATKCRAGLARASVRASGASAES